MSKGGHCYMEIFVCLHTGNVFERKEFVLISVLLFYIKLPEMNLNPFPPNPVFICPSCTCKVRSCPLFNSVFPPLRLSICLLFALCRIVFPRSEDLVRRCCQTPLVRNFLDHGRELLADTCILDSLRTAPY